MNRKIGLSLMAMVILIAAAMSQPLPPAHHSAEERVKYVTERFEKELKLSVSQKEKMTALYQNFFAELGMLHDKEHATPPPPPMPPANREAAEKLSKARDLKIKTVLNAEQYQKYIALERTMRPPPPPPNKSGRPKPQVTPEKKSYGY